MSIEHRGIYAAPLMPMQDDLGAEIGVFRFTSFHYDSCCDYSYLYRIEAWVRTMPS